MDNLCKKCNGELEKKGTELSCKSCGAIYKMSYKCDKCNNEVERLLACGSEQFFCNHCNELKSRSKVLKEITEK